MADGTEPARQTQLGLTAAVAQWQRDRQTHASNVDHRHWCRSNSGRVCALRTAVCACVHVREAAARQEQARTSPIELVASRRNVSGNESSVTGTVPFPNDTTRVEIPSLLLGRINRVVRRRYLRLC